MAPDPGLWLAGLTSAILPLSTWHRTPGLGPRLSESGVHLTPLLSRCLQSAADPRAFLTHIWHPPIRPRAKQIISENPDVKRTFTGWSFLWDDNEKIRDVNCIVAPSLFIKFQYPIQWSRSWSQSPWRTFWQESSKKHPLTPVRWQNYSANWGGILSEVKNFFLKLVHNLSVTNMFVNLTKPSPYVKVLNKLLYTECKLRGWAKQTGKDFSKHNFLANSNWETMQCGSLYANDNLWLCQIV